MGKDVSHPMIQQEEYDMLVPKIHEPPQDMKVRLVTQYDDRIPDIFTSFR